MNVAHFGVIIRLYAQMVDAGAGAAAADREIHARIVQHPLGVVGLADAGHAAEQRAVEGKGLVEIIDADMDVQAFHEAVSADVGQQDDVPTASSRGVHTSA